MVFCISNCVSAFYISIFISIFHILSNVCLPKVSHEYCAIYIYLSVYISTYLYLSPSFICYQTCVKHHKYCAKYIYLGVCILYIYVCLYLLYVIKRVFNKLSRECGVMHIYLGVYIFIHLYLSLSFIMLPNVCLTKVSHVP